MITDDARIWLTAFVGTVAAAIVGEWSGWGWIYPVLIYWTGFALWFGARYG